MSLVAYGSSDESEDEGQESPVQVAKDPVTKKPDILPSSPPLSTEVDSKTKSVGTASSSKHLDNPATSSYIEDEDEFPLPATEESSETPQSSTKLFSMLPAPKTKAPVYAMELGAKIEVPLEKDSSTKEASVKITIPSLSDFKEDDDEAAPSKKRLKPSAKGSGLFAILPPPRGAFTKQKTTDGSKPQAPLVPRTVTRPPVKPAPRVRKPVVKSVEDVEEDVTPMEPKDFFSLDSVSEVPDVPAGPLPDLVPLAASSSSAHHLQNLWATTAQEEQGACSQQVSAQSEETTAVEYPPAAGTDFLPIENGDLELTDEVLEKLCGRRALKQQKEMEVIEVHGAEIMPDPNEWLTKQLTEERHVPARGFGHRRHDGPTSQQRRKHQITYLAFQAKENELELKNQWSMNRMSRKQTQSKYGF